MLLIPVGVSYCYLALELFGIYVAIIEFG